MDQYMIINQQGQAKGVQTLTDSMADRMVAKGYQVIPLGSVPQMKITFGSKVKISH